MVITGKILCAAIVANSAFFGASGANRACRYSSSIVKEQLRDPKIGLPEGARKLNYWIYKYGKGKVLVGLCGYNAGFRCKGNKPNTRGIEYAKKVLKITNKIKRKIKHGR